MNERENFWDYLDRLVASSQVVIERRRGAAHPDYPDMVYPLDYGYLAGTSAADGDEVDVWTGSGDTAQVSAVLVTVDLLKRDTEVKVMLGCTPAEQQAALAFLNGSDLLRAWLVPRPPAVV
ncbi:MAG: inorganic pyrophosphatase [Aggregatilineaceae bacterium]